LVSNETVTAAARAAWNAANTASAADDEIAWLMPEACTTFAALMTSTGTSSAVMRLAAEPARI
jgi:hypothetical protein